MTISLEQIEKNFAEIDAAMSPAEARFESNCCLYCFDASCTRACPTHIDVPAFIKKIASGNLLGSARVIFDANPSATVAGLSEYLWKLEPPARAVANGYFVDAVNRVGTEAPWNIGEFYGQSYFCDPRGQIVAEGSRDQDELIVADLDMDKIREVHNTWQFFRDRRPDAYGPIMAD